MLLHAEGLVNDARVVLGNRGTPNISHLLLCSVGVVETGRRRLLFSGWHFEAILGLSEAEFRLIDDDGTLLASDCRDGVLI